jgi:hypothetical protein
MPEYLIDTIRFTHLIFFALGMGSGLYFDLHALTHINKPFTKDDIVHFGKAHIIVFTAVFGLWLSGVFLIYIRTGFVISEFTPKLWVKLIIVSVLTLNAISIGLTVLPRIKRSEGLLAIELPLSALLPMTITTALSISCWLSALVLGMSVILKTANWTILGTFILAEVVIIVFGSVIMILIVRAFWHNRKGLS